MKFARAFAISAFGLFAVAGPFAPAVAVDMSTLPETDVPLRLNSAVTVTGDSVRLGDLFIGDVSKPEKVVSPAPAPGQRMFLQAEWLAALARSNGLDWHPTGPYDRAAVYRPAQTFSPSDILAAVKTDLIAKGMPKDFGLTPALSLQPVVVAADAPRDIAVREVFFDAASRTFSAVAEIPAGTPNAQYIQIHGTAFPTVSVPVLKENAAREKVITADMLTTGTVPEDQVRRDTVTDANSLIGKSPRGILRAGQPIRDTDVAQLTLVDVPVLKDDIARDAKISRNDVTWRTVDASSLPGDAVTDIDELVGKSARRLLPAGSTVRAADLQLMREMEIPVAVHDLRHGSEIADGDVKWIKVNANDLPDAVITDEDEIVGLIARRGIRAGQPFRPLDVAHAVVVPKGKLVTIIMESPVLKLTARAKALESGGVNQVIRVSNIKSDAVVLAEVIDAETVRLTTATADAK